MGKFSEYPNKESPVDADKVLIYDSEAGATKTINYSLFSVRPRITLWNTNTLTIDNTATEYALVYDGVSNQTQITFTPVDSKIYIQKTGMYLVSVSALITTTNNQDAFFDLWIKVNGANLSNSNTQVGTTFAALQRTLAISYYLYLTQGDYFELFYHATNTNAQLLAVAAQTGPPVIPACPSVYVVVTKIGS